MCKRRDSIAAVDQAAERLSEACEAAIHGAAPDPAKPVQAGIGRALRRSFRELGISPMDMALQLKRIK